MPIDATALLTAQNWAKRRGHSLTPHEIFIEAEACLLRWGSVNYPQLDAQWANKTVARASTPVTAKPQPVDRKACRTLLGMTAKYGGVTANEGILAAEFEVRGLDATLDNFKAILPTLERERKLALSDSYTRAFQEFFTKHPEYSQCQSNIELLERSLRGADCSCINLEDLLDKGNPDYCQDQLALSPAGVQQQATERQKQADEAEKQFLVEQLSAHMLDGNGRVLGSVARGLKSSRRVYDEKLAELNGMSLTDLRKAKEVKDNNDRLRSLSTDQLRDEARKNFAPQQAQQSQRYAPIPPRYIPPGKTEECSVAWSPLLLKYLPKTETDRLMKIYGPEQLDAVVAAGRKQAVTQ